VPNTNSAERLLRLKARDVAALCMWLKLAEEERRKSSRTAAPKIYLYPCPDENGKERGRDRVQINKFIYGIYLVDHQNDQDHRYLGTAFPIAPNGGLLTCRHVVDVQRESKALTQMRSRTGMPVVSFNDAGNACRFNRYDQRCRLGLASWSTSTTRMISLCHGRLIALVAH
jgi:hypothetical protein